MQDDEPRVAYLGRQRWCVDDEPGSWHTCHTRLTHTYRMRHHQANLALVEAYWARTRARMADLADA